MGVGGEFDVGPSANTNEMSDYDAIVIGAGRRALRRAARRRRAVGRDRGAIPGRRRVRLLRLHPVEDPAAAGEALEAARGPGAREAVTGKLDRRRVRVAQLHGRGLPGLEQGGLARGPGIDLLRGPARPAGPGRVAVGEGEHGTANVVIATGSDAVIPPIPGLAEAEGVWTNREVTALTDVPERWSSSAADPSASKCPQAHRMGASVALVEGMDHLRRASRSRWVRRSAKPSARRASSCASDSTRRRCGSTTASTCSSSRSATSCAGPSAGRDRPQAPHRRSRVGHGRDRARQARDRGRHADVGRRGRVGDRRRHRHLAADLRREVPGRVAAANILGRSTTTTMPSPA